MEELARGLHVAGVVLWIGGVGLVTLALLPAVRAAAPAEALAWFAAIENRFAAVARAAVLLVGATGVDMLVRLNAWGRFTDAHYWWMHAMVLVWTLFALMLFVIEPFVLRDHFPQAAAANPAGHIKKMLIVHRVLLAASLVTVVGAVVGAHGG